MSTRTLHTDFQLFDPRNESTVHISFIHHSSGTIHATAINGHYRQTIAIQRRFFSVMTGASPDAVIGCIDVSPFIAATIGFIVNQAEGVESA